MDKAARLGKSKFIKSVNNLIWGQFGENVSGVRMAGYASRGKVGKSFDGRSGTRIYVVSWKVGQTCLALSMDEFLEAGYKCNAKCTLPQLTVVKVSDYLR